MAKLTKEKFLAHIQKLIGEDNSDEALTLLEDFTDTYDELEKTATTPPKTEGEDWETKYKENDASWRKKYRDRFNGIEETKEEHEEQKTDAENIHIADLFTAKESEVK